MELKFVDDIFHLQERTQEKLFELLSLSIGYNKSSDPWEKSRIADNSTTN